MNKNNEQKTNKKDVQLCFYHAVYDETYDCNYCGENHECLSRECCYAFFEGTHSDDELRKKLTQVVNNFMDEWDKKYFYTVSRDERACTRDDMMDMVLAIVRFRNEQYYLMENRLLLLNFDELNELLHMFHEVNYDGIEMVWHRVNELYFAKCDDYDGPDPCELEDTAKWRFGSREDYMEADMEGGV